MKVIILLLLSFAVHAGEKSPYKVIILDPSVDAKKMSPHQVEKKIGPKDFPTTIRRDSDFQKAGIVEASSLDELDKDVLWFDAKHASIEELQKKYPVIGKEKLNKLMDAVKK